jgi:hypothetical protein
MKVKIIKANSLDWYGSKIGEIFEVLRCCLTTRYQINKGVYRGCLIYKSDCEIITEEKPMNETYLMVNGNRVNLPESVLKDIQKSMEVKKDEADEFYELMVKRLPFLKNSPQMQKGKPHYPFIERLRNSRVLYIKLPGSNYEWSYAILDSVKEFCKNRDAGPWFSEEFARAGYISIMLNYLSA